MELQQIKQILEEKEEEITERVSELARDIVRKEVALIEFGLALESIPKENKDKVERAIMEVREEKWKKAMEKSNGNEEKAMFIYDEI